MTRFEHAAWYNLILANTYVAADKRGALITFLIISALCLMAAFFESQP